MLSFLTRFTLFLKIYIWIKPRLKGLVILFVSIFIISYSHNEYLKWSAISGENLFLGYSFVLKNTLIILSVLFYFLFTRKKFLKIEDHSKSLLDKKDPNFNKTFESLKNKQNLKTEYQRILEGSDESEK